MNNGYNFNQPIRRLLRDFEDKKSGKVVESRREIRRRFDYLDRPQQVRFLKVCFQSCKSDREWAYEELTAHWDPKFRDIISDLWHEFHEGGARRCIVKHFPIEFVAQEIESLDNKDTYYDLCLRLCYYGKFSIDKNRLTPLQVLSLYVRTGYEASDAEIIEQLYRLLINVATDDYLLFEKIDRNAKPRCEDFGPCRKAFYFIMEMQRYSILGQWKSWNIHLQHMLESSNEYHTIKTSPISDYEYREQMSSLFKKYMIEYLPKDGAYDLDKIETILLCSGKNEYLMQYGGDEHMDNRLCDSLSYKEIGINGFIGIDFDDSNMPF